MTHPPPAPERSAPPSRRTEAEARATLPPDYVAYVDEVAGQGRTHAANLAAWADLAPRPRVLRDVSRVDTATTVLGQRLEVPLLAAPTAALGLAHPEGDAALGRGALRGGGLAVRSMLSVEPWEETAARAPGPWWMQLYLPSDRALAADLLDLGAAHGATALCVTVDLPVFPYRGPEARRGLPAGAQAANAQRLARRFGITVEAVWRACFSGTLTFADLAWAAQRSRLPLVVKGVLDADDARRCVEHGAAAIVVSNHGGRSLDGVPATAYALPGVVDAVAGQVDVLVDGGVRDGLDVLRALALGARAALMGRPLVWALATGGEDGVAEVFARVQGELRYALALCGVGRAEAVDRRALW